jgi:hypothetical protein
MYDEYHVSRDSNIVTIMQQITKAYPRVWRLVLMKIPAEETAKKYRLRMVTRERSSAHE